MENHLVLERSHTRAASLPKLLASKGRAAQWQKPLPVRRMHGQCNFGRRSTTWTVGKVEIYAQIRTSFSSGLGRGFNVESSL